MTEPSREHGNQHAKHTDSRAGRRTVLGLSLAVVAAAGVFATVFIVQRATSSGQSAAEAAPSALAIEEVLRSSRSLLRNGRYGEAESVLASAVEAAPDDQDLRLAYAEALLGLRDFDRAHDQFLAAIAIGPDTPDVRFDAASVAHAAGLIDEAAEHYLQAQAMDPGDARYPLHLAQVQRKLGQTAEAKKNLLIAARLDESLDIAWGTLADIALEENKLSIARTHIQNAREIAPDSIAWRIVEARIERRGNNPERALGLLQGLSPEERARQPFVLREMALALGLLQRPADAANLYAEAAEIAPAEIAGQHFRLAAEWYERAEMIDEAIVHASRAARAGDEDAGALLDRLETRVRESAAASPDG